MLHEYRIMARNSKAELFSEMVIAESVTEALSKVVESEEYVIESISLSRSDIENIDNT